MHPAYRVGELPGRGVLDDEAARAGLHRPAQVAGPAERGDDQHPDVGGSLLEGRGRLDAVHARHLDVQQRHVRRCSRAAATTSSPADLRDHRQVGLQVEQRGERAPHQRLVVGQQQPDHRTATSSSNPCGRGSRVTTTAPTAAARSRSPRRPLPAPSALAGVADAVVGDPDAGGVEGHRAAVGAAVPDHVGDPLADRPGEQLAQVARHGVGASSGSSASMSAASSAGRARASSPGRVRSR